ncbi:MAG: glycosyltransferase [Clostridiaceae bacterium]
MNSWLLITLIFMIFDLLLVLGLMLKKNVNSSKEKKDHLQNQQFFRSVLYEEDKKEEKMEIFSYFDMKKIVILDRGRKEFAEKHVDLLLAEKKFKKGLQSIFKVRRIEAAMNLGLLGSEGARKCLEETMTREKDSVVKLYLANALSDVGNKASLPVLVKSLLNAHRFYRMRVNLLISDFGEAFDGCVKDLMYSDRLEIKELLVDFASTYYSENSRDYLMWFITHQKEELEKLSLLFTENGQKGCKTCIHSFTNEQGMRGCHLKKSVPSTLTCRRHTSIPISINYEEKYKKLLYKAYRVMGEFYPESFLEIPYDQAFVPEVKEAYVYAVSRIPSENRLEQLISFLKDEETKRTAVHVMSVMIEDNPSRISVLTKRYQKENDQEIKRELSKVLASRLEYFIMKLNTRSRKEATTLISEILSLGRYSEVIDFLNKNREVEIENELLVILKNALKTSPSLQEECARYLNDRLLKKCRIEKIIEKAPVKTEVKDKKLVTKLYVILSIVVLLFPGIFLLRHGLNIFQWPFLVQLKTYVVEFNYYIIYYAMSISGIYFILLLLSYINVNKQLKLWKLKNMSLMFKKGMLPTISIVAPAFNEEKTVIESVNSLLNLEYPDYELILVNDGSTDKTLERLIKIYNLKRVDFVYKEEIATKTLRGVYQNSSLPRLIVVDKENGGKGDSLNVGINISKKEYFCGIDADSLLEGDALLRLASMTLDQGIETPALGGNILPVNGLSVKNGQIKEVRLPQGILGKLQTIEYTRAFKAGRLGWAEINGLLIISGAFGLFRTDRVIRAGGYLTKSSAFKKDTVGEDMELVVRIARSMKEENLKYKICYSYNANCWTEVPEDLKSLRKQRYRWHKGLIDNLAFHSKMLFNPKYGVNGLISMPYFFIFEMFGPMIEVQGIIMVILAFLLGVMNVKIAMFLFMFTVMTGILISTASLVILEKDSSIFRKRDVLTLFFYAIIENFGPRQLISLWRVGSYFSMLKKPASWDKMERKGFNEKREPVKPMTTKDVLE